MTLGTLHQQHIWRVLSLFQVSHKGTTSTPTSLQLLLLIPSSSESSPQFESITLSCSPIIRIALWLNLSAMVSMWVFGHLLTWGILYSSHLALLSDSQVLQILMMSLFLSCGTRGIRR